MSFPALLNHLLPIRDPRTPAQIERDVDDEFAFHLAAAEVELTDAGASPEQARHAALERFGDPRKYRLQCRSIAMKERIMLQRINAILMVIVLLAVIGVSVQMYLTQRYNSLALADITSQLTEMKRQPVSGVATPGEHTSAEGEQPASTAYEASSSPVVYVSGSVQRPGVYELPGSGSLTLTRLLAAAGDLTTSPAEVRVMRSIDGEPTAVFHQTVSDLSELADNDLKLRRDDLILVHEEPKVEPGAAIASSPDEYETRLAHWGEQIRALPANNWRAAFALGQKIAALDPELGYRVLEAYWLDVPDAGAKCQLIKAWYFNYVRQLDHDAHMLHIMNLGMADPSVEAQSFPLSYLKSLVLRDFSLDFAAYEPWYERNRDRPTAEVIAEELQRVVGELMHATGDDVLRIVELIEDSDALRRDQSAALRGVLIDAGLLEILENLVSDEDTELTAAALKTIGRLRADEAYMRRVVVPFLEPDHEATVRSAATWAFTYAEAAWACDLLLQTLVDDFRRGGAEGGHDLVDTAGTLAELGYVKAIPTMIGIIDAQSDYRTVYGVGYFGLGRLTAVGYDESHDGPWWRDWWERNKDRFGPEVAALPIPEIEPPSAMPEGVEDLNAGGDAHMRYFLIGADSDTSPEEGYRVLLVLPGGDGGDDFQPFIQRIHEQALPPGYVVANLIAPQWSKDQFESVVWPTQKLPWPQMRFSTEQFIAAVIDDLRTRIDVDDEHIYALGWSSGGPPVYAALAAGDVPLLGGFVAMSVFKPDQLPEPAEVKGKSVYVLHSEEDFIDMRFPRQAVQFLAEHGAATKLATYEGGHGWHGDVFSMISAGVKWLEEQSAEKR